jgi:DNA polymerase III epsilon subunit-like protein
MDNKEKSNITRQEQRVIDWAQALFALPAFCILDTETTGLDDEAEIVEIAILDQEGKTLINQLVKPTKRIPQEVIGIHGITNEEVKKAPSFKTVWPKIRKILNEYQTIVIYNANFDTRMLMQSCQKHGTTPKLNRFTWHCAMNQYADFYGEWSDYWDGWKWQKLISAAHWAAEYLDCERHGAHRALNDCRNTLLVLKALAQYDGPREKPPPQPKSVLDAKYIPEFDEDVPF